MRVDPADLLSAAEVADVIGLANPNGVSVYARRYPDFPSPIVTKGKCVLWLRSDIVAWVEHR